jgi:ribosomal protein S18 acetylase RimI-like enzyme
VAGPEPPVVFRRARRDDLPAVVRLLADDVLGAGRETVSEPLLPAYLQAFDAIESDPNQTLAVAQGADGRVVGVLQLTFVPSLTHRGGWRAQIEGVRVAAALRSAGVGERMFEWAIDRARERGCRMVQLTTDRARPDAIRFYERLGFVASHVGMKLSLTR